MSKKSSSSVATPTWTGEVQRAASLSTEVCESGDLVGIDLMAQDGTVFAHAHMGLVVAVAFHAEFGKAIKNLQRRVN